MAFPSPALPELLQFLEPVDHLRAMFPIGLLMRERGQKDCGVGELSGLDLTNADEINALEWESSSRNLYNNRYGSWLGYPG